MRYAVTGAAGFVGSHLSELLEARGHEVVGIDCFTDYYDVALKEENARGREILRLDLAEDALDFAGLDGVFHLAGQPGVRSFGDVFPLYLRRNLLATQRVFEAAVAAGVRVVFTSSSSVYGEAERYPTPEETETAPLAPYGITKLGCEHLAHAYARDFGLDCVIARYFTVYGPRQRPDMFMARAVRILADGGTFELYGDGEQSRSFTYVGDAVEGTLTLMERGTSDRVYNVGGGEEATVNEAIALLERISGRTLDVVRRGRAEGDIPRTKADVARIRADTGWEPWTRLEDGLRAHWEWASARVGAR